MTDSEDDNATASRSRLAERRGFETTVYQPAEDSALLARATIDSLTTSPPGSGSNEGAAGGDSTAEGLDGSPAVDAASLRVLEVGTGSGWVAERLAAETGARVVASDLNPHACRQARARGLEAVRGDLLDPFVGDSFDAVAFNPPYLPTVPETEWNDWMERALSGGPDGQRLIDPFLADVGRVLAPAGAAFLLVSSLAGYDAVVAAAERAGFDVTAVAQESFPFEVLSVLRLDGGG